jgi:hypothetical protein
VLMRPQVCNVISGVTVKSHLYSLTPAPHNRNRDGDNRNDAVAGRAIRRHKALINLGHAVSPVMSYRPRSRLILPALAHWRSVRSVTPKYWLAASAST